MPDDDKIARDPEHDPPDAGWIAFEISGELRLRIESIVARLRTDTNRTPHAAALADVVIDMTDRGLHYYFLH